MATSLSMKVAFVAVWTGKMAVIDDVTLRQSPLTLFESNSSSLLPLRGRTLFFVLGLPVSELLRAPPSLADIWCSPSCH